MSRNGITNPISKTVILIGRPQSGKTAYVACLTVANQNKENYNETIGVDFRNWFDRRATNTDSFSWQIWDTGGHDTWKSVITETYILEKDLVLLCINSSEINSEAKSSIDYFKSLQLSQHKDKKFQILFIYKDKFTPSHTSKALNRITKNIAQELGLRKIGYQRASLAEPDSVTKSAQSWETLFKTKAKSISSNKSLCFSLLWAKRKTENNNQGKKTYCLYCAVETLLAYSTDPFVLSVIR